MAITIEKVQYFYSIIEDRPGEGQKLLEFLNAHYVNLLASMAFTTGDGKALFEFFPEDVEAFQKIAAEADMDFTGPRNAFLFRGEDKIGALVEYHLKLADAGIDAVAANGVSGGKGRFGYILRVDERDFEEAAKVLGM
jgi:hypothetical protein